MSEKQIEFLQNQVLSLTKENHLLKEDILAFHHFLNNRVKEIKAYLRDIPKRYLNMELCDITQVIQFVKEDIDYYHKTINCQQHEMKQLKQLNSELIQNSELEKEKYQLQISNLEQTLTEQYRKALKELQDKLQETTEHSNIYKNSISLLVQEKKQLESQLLKLQNESLNEKKKFEAEKNQMQLTIKRAKIQLDDTEKIFSTRIHKIQQQNFEEYQNKLKVQAKDLNEKDQIKVELEKKILATDQFLFELKNDYESAQNQIKEQEQKYNFKLQELQVLHKVNTEHQVNIKTLEIEVQKLRLENHTLNDNLQNQQKIVSTQTLSLDQLNQFIAQVLNELSMIGKQKTEILKQSSIQSQILESIKQITSEYTELQNEKLRLNQLLIKLQDIRLQLQEEQSQLIFQNEMFQQKISQLNDQILSQQEIEIKYRKLINELAYMTQSNPKIIKQIQQSVSINFCKEYSILNQVTEDDQNRPIFLLNSKVIKTEENESENQKEDKSQQCERVQTLQEIKSRMTTEQNEQDFSQSVDQQRQSFQWKNSIKMTLTPNVFCNKQEDQLSFSTEKIQDAQTQTERKKYQSKFVPHENLDEIVEELKFGGYSIIDTKNCETQTPIIIQDSKFTQTQNKRSSTKEIMKESKNATLLVPSRAIETNQNKQLEVFQTKNSNLTKIINELEIQLKDSLFLNDKLNDDFEQKNREYQRLKQASKLQLEEQMVDYENKIEQMINQHKSEISNLNEQLLQLKQQSQNKQEQLDQEISQLKLETDNQKQIIQEQQQIIEKNNNQILNLKQNLSFVETQAKLKSQELEQKINIIQNKFDNRPSREDDVEMIKELEQENENLKFQIQKNFQKIEHANEIVKYLQIEVENYKKQYNLFSQHKPVQLPKKKQNDISLEEDKSLVFDSKPDFLPSVTTREGFISQDKKQQSQRKRNYKLSDFEIKQHTTKIFFKNGNGPKISLNKTQYVSRPFSPTQSKNTKYLSTTNKKFNNPFDNDCILHNAEVLVENIKGNSPKGKFNLKSNDQFFLRGQVIQAEIISTSNSKQKI